ncbi:uncharacterized protein [Anas acuta]|uniref:uncharacterized protein isoform X2 n=1 Tax=Anas acuta TaxID=28680 RepID=UPI0035C8B44F
MSGRAGRRRLVLHLDINNTVLPADTVTGRGPREALNGFLCTATWGRDGEGGEWQWVSDRPSLRAPCPDAVSYYCRYGRDLAFTEGGAGQRFGDLHARYLRLLAWPGEPHEELSLRDGQGECYHLLLPSFYHLLDALHRDGRAFAIIFRTFGTDLPRVLRALRCALDGQHPQFPALRDLELSVDLTPGQIRCSKREVVLRRGAERLATREDGRKLYDYFSSLEGVGGFQDHYDWWARNQFSSRGGKPLWIDPHDPSVHHIFIDDNICLDDTDTIVCPLEPGAAVGRLEVAELLPGSCVGQEGAGLPARELSLNPGLFPSGRRQHRRKLQQLGSGLQGSWGTQEDGALVGCSFPYQHLQLLGLWLVTGAVTAQSSAVGGFILCLGCFRCSRSEAAAAPGAPQPRSCTTSAWCGPTSWRPSRTRTISSAA